MPLGVPRVECSFPGDSNLEWVDLYNCLYRERVLFLGSNLDDELANQLIAIILYLSAENPKKKLYLYINSPGGSLTCGLALVDTIKHITSTTVTVCMGLAASMASFVLTNGYKGLRIALPHSKIMIHQPKGGSQGKAAKVQCEVEEVIRLRKQVGLIYSQQTGQKLSVIASDMDRDRFFSSIEARKYGLVDHISKSI